MQHSLALDGGAVGVDIDTRATAKATSAKAAGTTKATATTAEAKAALTGASTGVACAGNVAETTALVALLTLLGGGTEAGTGAERGAGRGAVHLDVAWRG